MVRHHGFTALLLVIYALFHFTAATAVATRQNGIRIMIVGDSITQGAGGDLTWRFRLWQWLRANNVAFSFVGPWTGTFNAPDPLPPQPPKLQGAPDPVPADRITGPYAADIDPNFDKHHWAHSGRQAAQMKNQVGDMISQFNPDYLLVELGFNDLGWFISGPEGTLQSMKAFVDNARRVKPNLKFAIANVPMRTHIGGRDDLPIITDQYNALLASAIPQWNTAQSPIELVKLRENYQCM
jgi:lysophospholipase L1-like esterase